MSGESAFSRLLALHFCGLGALSRFQVECLNRHYDLMVRWNRVVNLTSIRGVEGIVLRHYCESLFLALHLPESLVSVVDVGSGAGFPGIPVAVMRPDCEVTLAESHQRKAVFLREATRDCQNIRVVSRRASEVAGGFECAVSRGVRWEEVLPVARCNVALLLGEEDAEAVSRSAGFLWRTPVRVPWGRRSVLVMGQRST